MTFWVRVAGLSVMVVVMTNMNTPDGQACVAKDVVKGLTV